jgi:putative NADH-flavin reductase
MRSARLTLALDSGAITLPETGRIHVFRPHAGDDLSVLPKDRVGIITGFRPDYDAFAAAGYAVSVAATGGAAAALVCLPRSKSDARALVTSGVAGGGILNSVDGGLRHDQPSFPAVFKKVSSRHKEAWHAMRDSNLDWTMIATGDIVPGERTGVYRTLEEYLPEGGRRISVEDVADFLLRALRDGLHLQKRVGAGY